MIKLRGEHCTLAERVSLDQLHTGFTRVYSQDYMPVEACTDMSPAAVWSQYISQRRPCTFRALPPDLEILPELLSRDKLTEAAVSFVASMRGRRAKTAWPCLQDHLRHCTRAPELPAQARACTGCMLLLSHGCRTHFNFSSMQRGDAVSVELQSGKGRAFGNGRKVQMAVAEVLQKLHAGSEELYLSTQDAPVEVDGFPALLTPPLHRMVDRGLPLKPAVMGNLIPQVHT